MRWVVVVKFTGRPMPGTEGTGNYIPYDDFCMNTEFLQWAQELVGVRWRWVEQWQRKR
jgi:hypothetical protein